MRRSVMLLVSTVVVAVGFVAMGSGASVPPARVVSVVPAGTGSALTVPDARTLKPVHPGWTGINDTYVGLIGL